jgi:hypothetical protein
MLPWGMRAHHPSGSPRLAGFPLRGTDHEWGGASGPSSHPIKVQEGIGEPRARARTRRPAADRSLPPLQGLYDPVSLDVARDAAVGSHPGQAARIEQVGYGTFDAGGGVRLAEEIEHHADR